jgi:hypothetical protein
MPTRVENSPPGVPPWPCGKRRPRRWRDTVSRVAEDPVGRSRTVHVSLMVRARPDCQWGSPRGAVLGMAERMVPLWGPISPALYCPLPGCARADARTPEAIGLDCPLSGKLNTVPHHKGDCQPRLGKSDTTGPVGLRRGGTSSSPLQDHSVPAERKMDGRIGKPRART